MPTTLEKDHEHKGDQLMAEYGFVVIRFSQSRATQQTEGIPDRRYYSPARGLAFWWEAKAEGGKQRAAQRDFMALCDATGDVYYCGTFDALAAWFAEEVREGFPSWRVVLREALTRLTPNHGAFGASAGPVDAA